MPEQTPPLPTLPAIRTMADDLAAVGAGRVPGPVAPGAPGRRPPLRPGAGISLPPAVARGGHRSLLLAVGVGLIVVIVALVLWGVLALVPRASGTVADVVPSEAAAFMSVQTKAPGADTVIPHLLRPFQGLSQDRLSGASHLVFLLLPGPSAGEPVPSLLVRGLPTVDLAGAPALSTHASADGVLIVPSEHLGRVQGLTGNRWGRERDFRKLARGGAAAAPVVVALRPTAAELLLQPVLPLPFTVRSPLLLGVTPAADPAAPAAVRLATLARGRPPAGGEASIGESLPAGVVVALVRPNAAADLATLPTSGVLPAPLVGPLQALGGRAGASAPAVRELLAGPWALGVLPGETAGVRDVVAILSLNEGSDPLPVLRSLEGSFATFAPALTGSAFPDAAFAEATVRGVTVRYANFGSAARAFDYAVHENRLLVGTSRASMSALIDAALDEGAALSAAAAFRPLLPAASGGDWIAFALDGTLPAEGAEPFRVIAGIFRSTVLRAQGAGAYEGLGLLAAAAPAGEPSPTPPPGVEGNAGAASGAAGAAAGVAP